MVAHLHTSAKFSLKFGNSHAHLGIPRILSPIELGDDKAAILSLGASAALLTAQGDDSDFPDTYPFPATNTMPLEPRSLLLIQRDAEEVAAATVKADARWGHCIHSGGRHLSLVFRSCAKSSK